MTETDKPLFLQAIARLAVALREPEPDVVQMRIYFEALHDLDIAFVTAAAERLQQSADWFPKAPEWRRRALAVETERREQQRAWRLKAQQPLCGVCDDTGWELVADVEGGQPVTRAKPCVCREVRWRELTGAVALPALPSGERR